MSKNAELLTVKEVAEFLRYDDVQMVYDLIHTGRLKASRINKKRYLIRRSDLEEFLDEQAVKVPQV